MYDPTHHHVLAVRFTPFNRLLVVLPALLAATACGGGGSTSTSTGTGAGGGATTSSSSSTGAGGAPSPLQVFEASFAASVCGAAAKCCTATFDEANCTTYQAHRDGLFPRVESATTAAFDAKLAADCLSAMTTAVTSCDPDPAQIAAARDLCQTLFPGVKKVDEPCEQGVDCAAIPGAERRCNEVTHECAYDTLTAFISPLGGPCNDHVQPVGVPAYHCDSSKFEWCNPDLLKCEAPLPAGTACGGYKGGLAGGCVPGYVCKGPGTAKCASAHAIGDACAPPGMRSCVGREKVRMRDRQVLRLGRRPHVQAGRPAGGAVYDVSVREPYRLLRGGDRREPDAGDDLGAVLQPVIAAQSTP